MIYCNFTKNRGADEIVRSSTRLWDSHLAWRVFDRKNPDDHEKIQNSSVWTQRCYSDQQRKSFLAEKGVIISFLA